MAGQRATPSDGTPPTAVHDDIERLARTAFDALTAEIAILDESATVVAVNAAWHRFAEANGYVGDDHGVGRNYLAVCAAATGTGAKRAMAMAQGIGEILAGRREIYNDGYPCHIPQQRRWFVARVTRFLSGERAYAVVAHEDVSAQRGVEEALRARAARLAAGGGPGMSADFRALFGAAPTPLLVVAPPDFGIIAANEAYLHATMATRADLLGHTIFEAFPDDPADTDATGERNLRASLERVVALRQPDAMAVQKYPIPRRTPEGGFEERWWSIINSPVFDPGGAIALIIHRVEDVTEIVRLRSASAARNQLARDQQGVIERLRDTNAALAREAETRARAEEALRASEAHFRTIFEQAMDAILIVDDAGYCLQANPAACALCGLPSAASFLGRRIDDLSLSADRGAARAGWRRLMAEGTLSGTLILLSPDGTTRTAEYRATARFQPGRHLWILRDVTEHARAADELADLQRQLTAARETERLRLARELHDTAVQQLLGISFQLAAYPQRTGAAGQQPEPASTLADIRRAVLDTVGHLRGVIRELRPPGLEEFGLTAALDGYLSAVRRERGADLPAIAVDLDHVGDDLPREVALCLFRVTQEALRNAIRHAEAREVSVSLLRDDREVALRVVDDGCGFVLPERLTTYTQLGHFGLAGMAERVKLLGGQCAIASSPGRGTTVTVRLPLGLEGEDDERDTGGDRPAHSSPPRG